MAYLAYLACHCLHRVEEGDEQVGDLNVLSETLAWGANDDGFNFWFALDDGGYLLNLAGVGQGGASEFCYNHHIYPSFYQIGARA